MMRPRLPAASTIVAISVALRGAGSPDRNAHWSGKGSKSPSRKTLLPLSPRTALKGKGDEVAESALR